MVNPVIAFVPCRAGSERVRNKNTRSFAGDAQGLIGIKLRQLLDAPSIDHIVLSTNDTHVVAIATEVCARDPNRLKIVQRPDHLGTSETSTDDLIVHALATIDRGVMLWTHVTSPFLGPDDYEDMIQAYNQGISSGTNDSLASVSKIQKFLWNRNGPVNYDRSSEKWPRTQTLEPIFELNSGAFIVDVELGRSCKDRIGRRPYLFPVEGWKGFDIDWEDDFLVGEQIFKSFLQPENQGQ